MAGERKNALRMSQGNHSSAARLEAQLMANRAGSRQIPMSDALATAAAPLARTIAVAAKAAWSPAWQLCKAFAHRRHVTVLSGLDDRMLRDIGLTRNDVRDAIRQPLWRDPTAVLASRAGKAAPAVQAPNRHSGGKAASHWNPTRIEISTMDKQGARQ
jgi:uncharacterized protein YjiS (DUF1127 family)